MTQPPDPPDIEAALAHHRAGRLAEAEQVYRAVLDRDPREPRALRNLSLLCLQKGEPARALPLAQAAVETDPAEPAGWRAYVRVLGMNGRFEDAVAILETRLADGPERRELEAAVRRAWASGLLSGGDEAAAIVQLRRVAEATPNDPDAHANLGRVLQRAGDLEAAAEAFARARALDPEHITALAYGGATLAALDRAAEAETLLRRAVELSPADDTAVRQYGAFLIKAGRLDEAAALADRALALAPGGEAWLVRGGALFAQGRLEGAMAAYQEAAEWAGQKVEALRDIGRVNKALGRYDAARAAFDRALALDPADSWTQLDRGMLRLMLGDFAGGWADYDIRFRLRDFLVQSSGSAASLVSRLDRVSRLEELAGRRVLLVAEQGIGDQVMFASMISEAAALAAEVTCVCDRRLVGLLSRSIPGVRFLDPATTEIRGSELDLVLPMGALAGLLRRRAEDFPGTPFLDPGPEARGKWAARLAAGGGPRIGLSWRGGTANTNAARRSMTLDQLAPILRLPGARFVSLQYGEVAAEVAEASARVGVPIEVFPKAEIDDFQDLAALIGALDAVVSVQNTVVHITGAVGRPCLAMLPNDPEWRYMAQSSAMPWYRSVELFRQPRPGAWAPVVEAVAGELTRRLGLSA